MESPNNRSSPNSDEENQENEGAYEHEVDISPEKIAIAIAEMEQVAAYNDKKKMKVLQHVVDYLENAVLCASVHPPFMEKFVAQLDPIEGLVMATLKLLIPLLQQSKKQDEVREVAEILRPALEQMVSHLKRWCNLKNNLVDHSSTFELTEKMATEYAILAAIMSDRETQCSSSAPMTRVVETPGAFYVEDSEEDEIGSEDSDSWGTQPTRNMDMNLTVDSMMEDPIPRAFRNKVPSASRSPFNPKLASSPSVCRLPSTPFSRSLQSPSPSVCRLPATPFNGSLPSPSPSVCRLPATPFNGSLPSPSPSVCRLPATPFNGSLPSPSPSVCRLPATPFNGSLPSPSPSPPCQLSPTSTIREVESRICSPQSHQSLIMDSSIELSSVNSYEDCPPMPPAPALGKPKGKTRKGLEGGRPKRKSRQKLKQTTLPMNARVDTTNTPLPRASTPYVKNNNMSTMMEPMDDPIPRAVRNNDGRMSPKSPLFYPTPCPDSRLVDSDSDIELYLSENCPPSSPPQVVETLPLPKRKARKWLEGGRPKPRQSLKQTTLPMKARVDTTNKPPPRASPPCYLKNNYIPTPGLRLSDPYDITGYFYLDENNEKSLAVVAVVKKPKRKRRKGLEGGRPKPRKQLKQTTLPMKAREDSKTISAVTAVSTPTPNSKSKTSLDATLDWDNLDLDSDAGERLDWNNLGSSSNADKSLDWNNLDSVSVKSVDWDKLGSDSGETLDWDNLDLEF